LWGRYPAVIESDISRKADRTSRANFMASSVAGSNSHGLFLREHLKESGYAVPSWTIEGLVAGFQVAVTTVVANMLRRVRENAVRCTAVCFEKDGSRL
jgi:hypothetical protein